MRTEPVYSRGDVVVIIDETSGFYGRTGVVDQTPRGHTLQLQVGSGVLFSAPAQLRRFRPGEDRIDMSRERAGG